MFMIINPLFQQFTQMSKIYNPAGIFSITGERNKTRGTAGVPRQEIRDRVEVCVLELEAEDIDYILGDICQCKPYKQSWCRGNRKMSYGEAQTTGKLEAPKQLVRSK